MWPLCQGTSELYWVDPTAHCRAEDQSCWLFAVINLRGFFFFFFCMLCFCVFLCVHKRTVASQPECSCSGNLRLFLLKGFEDQQAFPPGFTALLEEPVAAEVFSPVHPTLVVPYLTSTWIMLFADCLSSTMTSMDSS